MELVGLPMVLCLPPKVSILQIKHFSSPQSFPDFTFVYMDLYHIADLTS